MSQIWAATDVQLHTPPEDLLCSHCHHHHHPWPSEVYQIELKETKREMPLQITQNTTGLGTENPNQSYVPHPI
jgi:hypothetical protein